MTIKKHLTEGPIWLFSVITLICIFWLTLFPKPLGDNPPELFPGADKLAHAIMFGGLAIMMLFDWQRKHDWQNVPSMLGILAALLASCWGIVIEFAQEAMDLGRSFDRGDIIADIIGSFFFIIVYIFLQKFWCRKP